ncbi:MAG: DUF429 domain-containing protein [Myxococcota bacterium]
MDVCGIDWATSKARRYAVRLAVSDQGESLELLDVWDKLSEDDVHEICSDRTLDSVGVDVAFGWPREFCGFVSDWRPGVADAVDAVEAGRFMFRRTDRLVSELGLGRPLSVSTNLLGRSAQSWTHYFLVEEGPDRAQIDVLGGARSQSDDPPRLVEVYPKATLNAMLAADESAAALGLDAYDRRDAESRQALLEGLERAAGLRGIEPADFASNEHRVDALLAALATAIYASACRSDTEKFRGWTVRRPDEHEESDARREGWIFVPVR